MNVDSYARMGSPWRPLNRGGYRTPAQAKRRATAYLMDVANASGGARP
jgi:hypothetical protein